MKSWTSVKMVKFYCKSLFRFTTFSQMTDDCKRANLFGFSRRKPNDTFSQAHANLAFVIQQVTEEINQQLALKVIQLTGCRNLVMGGGVALNSVANGKLLDLPGLDRLWI